MTPTIHPDLKPLLDAVLDLEHPIQRANSIDRLLRDGWLDDMDGIDYDGEHGVQMDRLTTWLRGVADGLRQAARTKDEALSLELGATVPPSCSSGTEEEVAHAVAS